MTDTAKFSGLARLGCGAASFAIGVALMGGTAFAQDAAAAAAGPAAATSAAAAPEGTAGAPAGSPSAAGDAAANDQNVIVVTGSRIARPELEQASPIAVVSAQDFAQKGAVNVESVLNDIPQITGATTGTSNNPGGGIATVNLRGLGTPRTLVLVDGRRYINYSPVQVVDLNTIPAALIERVDVVTGGRSAVYGSDAIGGVVNFITKRNFEGFEGNATYQLSEQGDGPGKNVNATIGANFGGDHQGNVVAFVDYYKRGSIFASDRQATRFSYTDNGDGTLNPMGGSSSIPQFRFSAGSGALATGNRRFDDNGNIVPYSSTNDLYNFGAVNYLLVPQERFLGYTKAYYEISDHFKPYIEGQFINNRVLNQLAPTPVGNTTAYRGGTLGSQLQVQVNSPFIATASQATLRAIDAADATPNDGYVNVTSFGRRFLETGPRISNDERNAFRVLAGMEGDIFGGWSYNGYYSYARTKDSQVQDGNIGITALLNSVKTAFQSGNTISPFPIAGAAGGGTLVCADAAARAAGCVPSNIFGAGKVSSAAVTYIAIRAQNQTVAAEQVASLALTNSNLFDLGAGGVGVALGVEYRKESAQFIPDTFLSSGDVAGFNAAKPTSGSYNLTEFFGEVNVPLLSDLSFAKKLELNGAARYSMYSNAVNNVFTWTAGAIYQPIKELTLRGQYSVAIRGPNVNELFQGTTNNFAGAVDPCLGPKNAANATLRAACIATGVPAAVVFTNYGSGGTSFNTLQGGNPNLREEKAKTYTVGGILQPSFIRNFAITVDYYNINISNYISTVGTQNIVDACYTYSATQYCSQIRRAATGEFESFVDTNVNAGSLKTHGIDFGATFGVPLQFGLLGEESKLSFRYNGSYLMKFTFVPVVGLPIVNECAGRFGRNCSQNVTSGTTPKYRHALRTSYADGGLNASVQWRYIGKVRDDDDKTLYGLEKIRAVNYFDGSLGFDVNDHFGLTFAVNNIFNKGFQPGASVQQGGNVEQSNTYPETYDVLGRYFSISGKIRF